MFPTHDMNPIAIRHHFEERDKRTEASLGRTANRRLPVVSLIAPVLVLAVMIAVV